jgi:hypothetical protein
VKKRDLRTANDSALVSAFREAAIAQGLAMSQIDPKTANQHADIIYEIGRILKARGADSQVSIMPLLEDENVDVRLWAAAEALGFAPERAIVILKQIEEASVGFRRTSAHYTLKEWQKKQ